MQIYQCSALSCGKQLESEKPGRKHSELWTGFFGQRGGTLTPPNLQ